MSAEPHLLEIDGYCPICEAPARFVARTKWYRGSLFRQSCVNGSSPRERALAHVLHRELPHWRTVAIHECSPMNRGVSMKIRAEAANYVGTHYFPDRPFGAVVDGWRNENIEKTTFPDESFDLVLSLDVTEHVFDPGAMFRDIYRTLRPGGLYVSTFPVRKWLAESAVPLARLRPDGGVDFLKDPPEYHGNPIDGKGSLVTWDYGYDIHLLIAYWAPFAVEVSRFNDRHLGILGEYTEVFLCRKR
jgi:SAM-dependent methyltransferase